MLCGCQGLPLAILTFIEKWFRIPPLTKRDATQMDMTEFFDFQNVPWAAHPFRRNGQRLELAIPRTWDIRDLSICSSASTPSCP